MKSLILKFLIVMKKTYIKPLLEILDVELDGALLQNISISNNEINESNAGFTKEERSEWSNIWE